MTDKKEMIRPCEFFNICEAACGGTLEDIEICSCYGIFKQLKQSEQNAQDTYDMFKACMQSLEIARKQLSDEQQKVYQIGKICEKYSVNYVANTGVRLMVNEITDIIGDKTDEQTE